MIRALDFILVALYSGRPKLSNDVLHDRVAVLDADLALGPLRVGP